MESHQLASPTVSGSYCFVFFSSFFIYLKSWWYVGKENTGHIYPHSIIYLLNLKSNEHISNLVTISFLCVVFLLLCLRVHIPVQYFSRRIALVCSSGFVLCFVWQTQVENPCQWMYLLRLFALPCVHLCGMLCSQRCCKSNFPCGTTEV